MSFDTYTTLFPHAEITSLHNAYADQTCQTIEVACVQLKAYAAVIHSDGGNDILGLLAFAIGADKYELPVHLSHTPNATAAQISGTN